MFGIRRNELKQYKVGIVSDSHNRISQQMVGLLRDCDYILHAGDVNSERVLDQFRYLGGRLLVAKGNCDRGPWTKNIITRQLVTIGELTFLIVHNQADAGRLVRNADIVIFGHTHRYTEEMRKGRLWLNPGSCGNPRYGNPASMVIMEVKGREYSFEKIILEDI